MKKLLVLLLILLTGGFAVNAQSSLSFMNKLYNLKYSKNIGKNSSIEVYTNSSGNSVIMKGLFSMEDAESKELKNEMNEVTKDIIKKDKMPKMKASWSKMDFISNTEFVVASCVNVDENTRKYACNYTKTKYVNNNTQVAMFIYTRAVDIPSSSNEKTFLDSEYEKIKPNLTIAGK